MHDIKTINDAIKFYRSPEKQRQVNDIKRKLDGGVQVTFKNDNYVNALCLSEVLFSQTKDSLRIITGSNIDLFFGVLRKFISEACDRVRKAGGKLNILLLNKDKSRNKEDLRQSIIGVGFKPEDIVICDISQDAALRHYIISDEKHYRIEEPHGKLDPDARVDSVKADVVFNDKHAHTLAADFDDLFAQIKEKI